MSLGFLTESALGQRDQAVVFRKDQERKRRLKDALTAENNDATSALRLGKYAHLRGGKRRKRSDEDRVGKKHRNKGVEARNRRDEEAKAREAPDEDDDEAWSKKSAEMLRKKAKLYDEMANGGGRDHLKGECLVDFDAKKNMTEASNFEDKTMVEITDEFGRTRKVETDSEEYAAFLETQQYNREEPERQRAETKDKDGGHAEGGSFVVSQWEKRLKSSEKLHLKEVHERATLAHSASSGAVNKKTRKQLRLERLRKQREEATEASENIASTSTAVDSAASEKATNFLNQLSSLM